MIEEQPNLNTGKPWSELALADLKDGFERQESLSDLAQFLCRAECEVREKASKLGYAFRQD